MAKLRINGDSSGYVDLEAPNAASSSTLDLDQVPQKNVANTFSAVNNFTGNVGINRSTPQSKFEAWTNNGELSHFGSNNTNANNNYTGISLGYAEAGANSNYRKVGIVAVGRGDGAARQDLAFLVDSNSDGNSVDLNDAKMRISYEGYVTMPSQPSCYVRANSGGPWETDDVVIFNGVDTNIGNCYNTSNGRFTAPVNGRYMFSFIAMAPAFFRGQIRKNGAAQTEFRSDHDGATGLNYTQAAITVIYSMSVGDYVDQFISAGIMNGNGNEVQMHAHLLS